RLCTIYVCNSANALINRGNRAYVCSKGAIEVLRSSILPSALSTCPCHSDHFRRSIWSRICSPNTCVAKKLKYPFSPVVLVSPLRVSLLDFSLAASHSL